MGNIVVAVVKVEAKTIWLPPCIPKQSKVHDRTEHPYAVKVTEKVMRATEDTVRDADGLTTRVKDFFLMPEFKCPARVEAKAAAAGNSHSEAQWKWSGEDETMHPFWCVRRMTEKQMQAARSEAQKRPGTKVPQFNCELQPISVSDVNIAVVGGRSLNRTRIFEVPFLTNTSVLEQGEELIFQVSDKAAPAKPKRTWMDAQRAEDRKKQKPPEKKS